MIDNLVIGSRGSDLALWQAEWVKKELIKSYQDIKIEIKTIKTKGDLVLDKPLTLIGGKGVFTKEIEEALLTEEIDIAVHSCKDLPTLMTEGLMIGAIPVRETPSDVLITVDGVGIDSLKPNSVIGTGSLRRAAQLLYNRKDLKTVDIRGNIPTRLRKFNESNWGGMILAYAGLKRLNLLNENCVILDYKNMLPAVAQGAIALQIRAEDTQISDTISVLNDKDSSAAVTAERSLLRRLEGGCQIPIGAISIVEDGELSIESQITNLNGVGAVRDKLSGHRDDAEELGIELAEKLLQNGGKEILNKIAELTNFNPFPEA
ncbi:hydroxymethylbilane synthase [Candidatus Marinimicrobia bacterium MT.SAG.4]|nr:hydroxymethylbilane synthase [Candidatus Marinimicrobia bacterium MT.SAG.4]